MSVAVDKWKYKLPYKDIFGGVVALNTATFRKLNGFSNQFWGWGGEDDDMFVRIKKLKLKVERYDKNVARYSMIRHGAEEANKIRMLLLKTSDKRRATDGLKDLNYTLIKKTGEKLFSNITVKIEMPKELLELEKEEIKKAALKAAKKKGKQQKNQSKGVEKIQNKVYLVEAVKITDQYLTSVNETKIKNINGISNSTNEDWIKVPAYVASNTNSSINKTIV